MAGVSVDVPAQYCIVRTVINENGEGYQVATSVINCQQWKRTVRVDMATGIVNNGGNWIPI